MEKKKIEQFISKQKVSFVCSVDHDGFEIMHHRQIGIYHREEISDESNCHSAIDI